MKSLGEAVEAAKKKVLEDDCGYVVLGTKDGFELKAVFDELDIEPNFVALVGATEITFFTHAIDGIIAEVVKYGQEQN